MDRYKDNVPASGSDEQLKLMEKISLDASGGKNVNHVSYAMEMMKESD